MHDELLPSDQLQGLFVFVFHVLRHEKVYGKIKSKLPNVRKWVSIEVHCTTTSLCFTSLYVYIIVGNMMLPLLCVYTYTGDSHHWKCKCFSYRWVKFA